MAAGRYHTDIRCGFCPPLALATPRGFSQGEPWRIKNRGGVRGSHTAFEDVATVEEVAERHAAMTRQADEAHSIMLMFVQ